MTLLTREQVLRDSEPQQTATLGFISPGVAGVKETLKLMISIVKQYRKNSDIRALAESIIQNVPEKDSVGEVRAIFNWVRDNIRYTMDVRDVETLKTPDAVIYSGQGDCDDKSTLLSTLLETIGYVTRFVAVGMNTPGVYEHVYVQVKLGTLWIGADATENFGLGWEPPNPVARMERHI